MSVKKTAEEVALVRKSAALLSECLDTLVAAAKPGVSGFEIDLLAEEFIRDNGALPAFKNYGPPNKPFPASICFSRNHHVVHGIPTRESIIKDGDVITIDCGLSLNGWFADAARLIGVGEISQENSELIQFSKAALNAGIETCRAGNYLGDVCHAIQKSIASSPFYNVYQFCGHAIGKSMHEEPQVPNYGRPGTGIILEPGMIFCLEPILLKYRGSQIGVLSDGWTIVTKDGSTSTHIEEMVLITDGQPEVLSKTLIA